MADTKNLQELYPYWDGTRPAGVSPQEEAVAKQAIIRVPLIGNTATTPKRSYNWITEKVCGIIEAPTPLWWLIAIAITSTTSLLTVGGVLYLIATGVGVWGLNHPVGWAWDITNFVFWIGIGHAGTLISAILFLTRQKWRTSINRSAEAMTLFAVVCAGIFPGVHVGRIWMVWFLAPLPNANGIWPNFRSPLLWDVFAVSTYFTVSVLFWYVGLVPDLATLRDRVKSRWCKWIYGFFSLGWRGSNKNWSHYEMAYLILAGISTPLVLSVRSVVSFDFATSVVPGWHTTIFPPYFVAGAIFGGFAMVLTILMPARLIYGLEDLVTDRHIELMCKIIALTGSIVGYAYLVELFIAWYGANLNEKYAFWNRVVGPYWWAYACMMSFNVIAPQAFWFQYCRRNWVIIYIVINFVNAGMWFERFVIIVTSVHRDYLPGAWGMFHPTATDILTFVGTFGIFLTLFLLFVRFLPMIAIAEVKAIAPESDPHYHHPDDDRHPVAATTKPTHAKA
ncbi:MAG: NrfD/PsrC family molybdoenzyme membrane anchor subunit [Candidatus Methylacidiphilales bacterium]